MTFTVFIYIFASVIHDRAGFLNCWTWPTFKLCFSYRHCWDQAYYATTKSSRIQGHLCCFWTHGNRFASGKALVACWSFHLVNTVLFFLMHTNSPSQKIDSLWKFKSWLSCNGDNHVAYECQKLDSECGLDDLVHNIRWIWIRTLIQVSGVLSWAQLFCALWYPHRW